LRLLSAPCASAPLAVLEDPVGAAMLRAGLLAE
jgi:hypothetical protein